MRTVKAGIGARVKKGDLLAALDPQRYRLDGDAARAELEKTKADAVQKAQNLERQNDLHKKGWVGGAVVDQAVATNDAAHSTVAFATARLDRAQRDLASTETLRQRRGRPDHGRHDRAR